MTGFNRLHKCFQLIAEPGKLKTEVNLLHRLTTGPNKNDLAHQKACTLVA